MKPAKSYSPAKGFGAFLLCSLLSLIAGFTLIPVTAILPYFAVPLAFSARVSWPVVNLAIALVLAASSRLVYKIIALTPGDADATLVRHSATDAIYGTIGFELGYLVAWLGLYLLVTQMAPL